MSNTVYTNHSTMTQSSAGGGQARGGQARGRERVPGLEEVVISHQGGAQRLRSATCILISSAIDCPNLIHNLVEKPCLVRLTMTIPTIRGRGKSRRLSSFCMKEASLTHPRDPHQ